MTTPSEPVTVIKLGGELLEDPARLEALARALVEVAAAGPTVVVHGGGKEIDRELRRRGIERRTVDGLRITDGPTLEAVVAVLAGVVNTRLVAALAAAGARPVGLTGADAGTVRVDRAPAHRTTDGRLVDLELVGRPTQEEPPALVRDLCSLGYVPVVACIGSSADGRLFNVNADTLAAHLAVSLGASRLVIAGATAGVLDAAGSPIAILPADTIQARIASGEAHGGMAAKLSACLDALRGGVAEVVVVDGRAPDDVRHTRGTRIVAASSTDVDVAAQRETP